MTSAVRLRSALEPTSAFLAQPRMVARRGGALKADHAPGTMMPPDLKGQYAGPKPAAKGNATVLACGCGGWCSQPVSPENSWLKLEIAPTIGVDCGKAKTESKTWLG